MERLCIWFNTNRGYIYSKIISSYGLPVQIGSCNSYGHVLLEVFDCRDGCIRCYEPYSSYKLRIIQERRNKRDRRLFNRLFNK